jgi:hypothetical protein
VVHGLDRAVGADRSGVVEVALLVHEPDHGHAAAAGGGGGHLLQGGAVVGHEPGPQQQVLGRVAGDRELGQDQQVAAGIVGGPQRLDDAGDVAVEIPDAGVDLAQGDTQAGHGLSVLGDRLTLRGVLPRDEKKVYRASSRGD